MDRIEELRTALNVKNSNGKKSLKHSVKHANFLPFQTRNPERAKFGNGFDPILGEIFRKLEGTQLNDNLEVESLIEEITSKVEINTEDKPALQGILASYLGQSSSMRMFHPLIFNYISLSSNKEAVGEKDIAQYIVDSLLGDSEDLRGIMALTDKEHVLTRLICSNLPELPKGEAGNKYAPAFTYVESVFKEDLAFLVGNREFFISHINLFIAYYYFYSVTQFTLKLNQFENMEPTTPTPLYYNVDWENSNRSRLAVTKGFKTILESARRLLIHINTLEQLNILMGTKNLHYAELMDKFKELDEVEQKEIVASFNEWIVEYSDVAIGSTEGIDEAANLEQCMHILHHQIVKAYEKGSMQGPKSRYALALTEIGRLYFLKTRGSLGHTLNVTQDFLLLLTAISVKYEKISLKQLFIEYEKRGVYFDRYSRESIVELLNKLNLIEKKSDSGDAQYVKPIL